MWEYQFFLTILKKCLINRAFVLTIFYIPDLYHWEQKWTICPGSYLHSLAWTWLGTNNPPLAFNDIYKYKLKYMYTSITFFTWCCVHFASRGSCYKTFNSCPVATNSLMVRLHRFIEMFNPHQIRGLIWLINKIYETTFIVKKATRNQSKSLGLMKNQLFNQPFYTLSLYTTSNSKRFCQKDTVLQ